MAKIPVQQRFVDPFAGYNSNAVNMFTRMVTGLDEIPGGVKGKDCILARNTLMCTRATSSTAILSPGSCVKSDVFITISQNFIVDFNDSDFYTDGQIWEWDGYYYIVLGYNYEKTDPAPQASITILRPDQISLLPYYLLLNVVSVHNPGPAPEIEAVFEYNPASPSIERKYNDTYIGYESVLPSWDDQRDRGRIIMTLSDGYIYIGGMYGWINMTFLNYKCNTWGCAVGDLAYIGTNNTAFKAISTNASYGATCFVVKRSSAAGMSDGLVCFGGFLGGGEESSWGWLDTTCTVTAGDTLYLSASMAGRATNVKPSGGYIQKIGICMYADNINHRFTTVLSTSSLAPNHNSLQGLEGSGIGGHYYHLDSTQYANYGLHERLTDLDSTTATHLHLTRPQRNTYVNWMDGTRSTVLQHNNLAGINGSGTYHITQNQFEVLDGLETTVDELNALHDAGCTHSDFEKLADTTSTAAELNVLHGSGVTTQQLGVLANLHATAQELNALHDATCTQADFIKLHRITASESDINQLTACGCDWDHFNMLATVDRVFANESRVALGAGALQDLEEVATFDTAIGQAALRYNTSGSYNTAIGQSALYGNTNGNYNTAIGRTALYNLTSGSANTALGCDAARRTTEMLDMTSANQSVYIGYATRGINGDTNVIVIGSNAKSMGNNSVVLGNENITTTILRGNTGINVVSPQRMLDVNGWGRFRGAGAGNRTDSGAIEFYNTVSNSLNIHAQIKGLRGIDDFKAGQLSFFTSDATTGTLYERMTITESGRVGIGKIAPICALDVAGAIASNSTITAPNFIGTASDATTLVGMTTAVSALNKLTDSNLRFVYGDATSSYSAMCTSRHASTVLIQPYVYNIDSTSSAFETRYIVTLASNPNAYVNSTFNVFGIDFNYWENGYVITSTSLGMNVLSMHDSSSLLDAGWATVNIDVDHDQLAIKVEDNDTEDRWEAIYKSDYIEFVNTPHDSWMHTGRFRAAITEEYISYEPIWDTLDEQWKFNLTQITSLELEAEDLGMDSTNVEIPPMHSHYVVDSTSAVKGEIYEIHFDPFILGVIATADCLEDGKITIQVFNFTGVTQEPDYFDIKLHRKTMKRSF